MTELHSFSVWASLGYVVDKGQQAEAYWVKPSTGQRIAVFRRDQVLAEDELEAYGWKLVPGGVIRAAEAVTAPAWSWEAAKAHQAAQGIPEEEMI